MVYGCAVYPIDNKTEMSKMEFADSKQLTEKKREEIFKKIQNMPEKIYWITHVLSPNYISNSMLKRQVKLFKKTFLDPNFRIEFCFFLIPDPNTI